ncbi:molybdopterin-dependent oxidoreductase [Micromonospora sp. CPCC 206171]
MRRQRPGAAAPAPGRCRPWLVEAVGNAEWTGTPLAPLLREAGIAPEAVDVVFTGADHGVERGVEQDYQRALPVADALREEVLLAYEMNGAPLLPQHGAPLRLIVPGWYGMAHVRWLRGITVLTEEFDGYRGAGQCSALQGGGEGPRWEGRQGPSGALDRAVLLFDVLTHGTQRCAADGAGEVRARPELVGPVVVPP